MIVDCHTHIWASADQLGADGETHLHRQVGQAEISADPSSHALSGQCVDKTLVLSTPASDADAKAANEFVAEYVAGHSNVMIGVAAVDPTEPDVIPQAEALLDRNEFRGLVISPAVQNFHPADTRAMSLYDLAAKRTVPLFFHQGAHFPTKARMEYARPSLLDEIACEYPDLNMVICSLGAPWINEGIALLGKHPHVFGDISGLIRRPWEMYNTLVLTHQFNVMDKLLFGSGFPHLTAAKAIERVYRLHEITQGTNLPSVPREALRSVVERDALKSLGLARAGEVSSVQAGTDEQP